MEDLARLSFKRAPLYVGIDDQGPTATREGLEQGYCMVPSAQRFLLLFTFLKKNVNKKVRPGTTLAPAGWDAATCALAAVHLSVCSSLVTQSLPCSLVHSGLVLP